MTILLLEDETLIALDLQYALEAAGHSVTALSSNQAAYAWLDDNTPSAAIIDLKLRDGDSRALADRLANSQIPMVIYTGHDIENTDLAASLHQVPILKKPADQEGIVATLHAQLAAVA
ncbi:response regulator [Pelagibacterium sp. 26DY04]|uniref:response regulator n=1 Tax=Pelagibacterium sp. 26DY04 TaxID=2967130 RepID=UPI002814AA95|nr:response regulator [Pelagibacterium sp. 26DY04]WMT88610.1 response regulator [Pelagibacterium sp. 26DY04]